MMANAAMAVALGLGRAPGADPPPLYAYDPEIPRIAVTTPSYSTAIVGDNRGAFPYGGMELARLFGPDQTVAANVGGTPPSAFGLVLADRGGHVVLSTQRRRVDPAAFRVIDGPAGALPDPVDYPERPYAGPFGTVAVRVTAQVPEASVAVVHRFTASAIESTWEVTASRPLAVRAGFPTYGARAHIEAIRRDGGVTVLAGPGAPRATPRIALGDVAEVRLGRGVAGGYRLVPLAAPGDAALAVLRPRPQATDPRPGPTLAIRFAASPDRAVRLAVRITPSRSA
jgi:hypothetical protein